ncbi:unnamed protein product, partial [Allacma fusca]
SRGSKQDEHAVQGHTLSTPSVSRMTEEEPTLIRDPFEPPPQTGKKVFGIDFAPLKLPLERRLQTLAVAAWIYTFFLMGPLGLVFFLYLFFFTNYGFLAVLYLAYFLYDKDICNRGGRRSKWVRDWGLWKHYCNYFPIYLVKTAELDPRRNYLFGSHPHGVLCSGAFGCFATEGVQFSQVFPDITPHLLTLEGHYSFPVYRDYIMCAGACSASRDSINYLLSRPEGGHAAVLVPGGAPEALDSHPGREIRVHVNRRKGFIKMAIRNGAPLVPVFSFGETKIYDQVPNPEGSAIRKLQDTLTKILGLAPVFFVGRGIFQYTFGLVPKRHPIYVVVGTPVETVRMAHPTQEAIDETHKRYADALMDLFNKYKGVYGKKEDVLLYI